MYQPMTLPDLLFAAADRAGYVNGSGKLKRKELADALGIGEQALNSYLTGSRDISTERLNNMLVLLGVYGIAPFKGNQWMALDVDYKARSDEIVSNKMIALERNNQQKAQQIAALKAEIDMLKNQLNNKSDIVDKPVNQQIETNGDAIVGEPFMTGLNNKSDIVDKPVNQQKAGGRPAKFKVEQLEQWLKEQGGYKGTIDDLALHAFGKVGKDGKMRGAPGRHWMYKALAKLENEGKIAKEAATRSGINIVA
ncbi:helix-turn-helix domain-containing protein [Escherichia coli]|uniref:helix-turn-helix domain-containing protein n=1 Tax=Escherichia coli TaxID=562 RepID=UPI000DE05C8C|nr:helix-turn-helix transcriptional regulator [Escherichia coli]MBS0117918.1 helix-turn-helix transcriptional regulator [Escherichia coli]MCK2676616.1 helix-turn-helix domain-containing protein [Escherichia coli]